MIGRDRIVLRWENDDGDPVEKVVRGIVVMQDIDAELPTADPFIGKLRFRSFLRVILPRTLDLSTARDVTLSFRDYSAVRPETAIAPIYDARGGIHHYEAVIGWKRGSLPPP